MFTLSNPITLFMTRLRGPNSNTLLLAIVLGLANAAAVWLFSEGIDFFNRLFTGFLAETLLSPIIGALAIVVSLTLAGAIVDLIMERFIGEERHHGVVGIIESVAMSGGRLNYQRTLFKAIASALSLGAGAPVGPEDPSVQIGSNLGSFIGQRLHLSDEQMRLLVAAGNVMTTPMIIAMTGVGGLMLMGLALILLDIKKPRMANFLPALILAPLIVAVAGLLHINIYPLQTAMAAVENYPKGLSSVAVDAVDAVATRFLTAALRECDAETAEYAANTANATLHFESSHGIASLIVGGSSFRLSKKGAEAHWF